MSTNIAEDRRSTGAVPPEKQFPTNGKKAKLNGALESVPDLIPVVDQVMVDSGVQSLDPTVEGLSQIEEKAHQQIPTNAVLWEAPSPPKKANRGNKSSRSIPGRKTLTQISREYRFPIYYYAKFKPTEGMDIVRVNGAKQLDPDQERAVVGKLMTHFQEIYSKRNRIPQIKKEKKARALQRSISSAARQKVVVAKPQIPDDHVDKAGFLSILGRSNAWWDHNKINHDVSVVKVGVRNYYSIAEAEKLRVEVNDEKLNAQKRRASNKTEEGIAGDETNEIDSIKLYLHEIGEYPLLDKKDEERIGERLFEGQLGIRSLTIILEEGLLNGGLEYGVENFLKEADVKNIKRMFDKRIATSSRRVLEGKADKRGKLTSRDTDTNPQVQQANDIAFVEDLQGHSLDLEREINSIRELPLLERGKALMVVVEKYTNLVREGVRAYRDLVNSNLRLVFSIAKMYRGEMPIMDLVAYGNLGLMEAAGQFNFKAGFKFSTYATWWIRQSIRRNIADHSRNIRIPVHMDDKLRNYRKTSRALTQALGREPTTKEVLAEVGGNGSMVRQAMHVDKTISLNLEVGTEDDGSELGDFISDPDSNVEEGVSQLDKKEVVMEVISTLTPKEQKVLILRFGLEDDRSRTLEEVGREFNVSRERIRQIESQAFRKLRHSSRSKILEAYLD